GCRIRFVRYPPAMGRITRHRVLALYWLTVPAAAFIGVLAKPALAEETPKALPPLKLFIDKSKVDLDRHRLEVKMSRQPGLVKIKVFGESGDVIADGEQDFSGRPAGSALEV